MTYSIIIPIYNEEITLISLLNKLMKLNKNIEIIIIDDGSDDGTREILKNNERIKVISNEFNIGKGAAILAGVSFAKKENIILYDGDLEVDIEDIPRLIDIFENNNFDVLVGTRWDKKHYSSDINSIGNHFLNGIFNMLFNSRLSDVLCCVKIINTDLLKSLKIKSHRFSFEVETMAKIVSKNLIFSEVQINYNRRSVEQGKKLKISDGWSILWCMIKIKLCYS